MSIYIRLAWHLLIIVFIAFARVSGEEVKCGQRYIDLLTKPEGVNTSSSDQIRNESKRIIGGHEANHGAFPWQVKIAKKGEEKLSHLCGGVILSEYWILTAAHCYKDKNVYTLIVGDYNESELDDGEQEFDVEGWILHEEYTIYRDRTVDSDIALIKVTPIEGHGILFNQYVQPVCLPDPSIETDENVMCAASGWGAEYHGTKATEILRYVHMPIWSQESCMEKYNFVAPYTDRMICAGYKEGGVDTCQGDSGGLLVCIYNGDYTLFGITSWGPKCGTGLGYYANVRFFMPWIIENMNATFLESPCTFNWTDFSCN